MIRSDSRAATTPSRLTVASLTTVRPRRLNDLPGGTRPTMAEVAGITGEVDAISLLHGLLVMRGLVSGTARSATAALAPHGAGQSYGSSRAARGALSSMLTLLGTHMIVRRMWWCL